MKTFSTRPRFTPGDNTDTSRMVTAAEYDARAADRIREIIAEQHAAVRRELESRIAEGYWPGSFKNELIRRQGPWRDVNQVELATAEWVVWFNTERPHEYLDDFTPEAVETLYYDHKRTPPKAG